MLEYGNPPSALARCHPLSKRGRLGVVNSNGFRIWMAFESARPKRLLWQRGGAECAQWAMQRGGSPVSKGAQGSRPCGDTARPLRTVGPVTAQAVTEDCFLPQRLTRLAAHSHGGLSPCPLSSAERGEREAKGLRPFTACGKRTDQKAPFERSCHGASRD